MNLECRAKLVVVPKNTDAVLTYGAKTLTLIINSVQIVQRCMERSMLSITLRDMVPNVEIRKPTSVKDSIQKLAILMEMGWSYRKNDDGSKLD